MMHTLPTVTLTLWLAPHRVDGESSMHDEMKKIWIYIFLGLDSKDHCTDAYRERGRQLQNCIDTVNYAQEDCENFVSRGHWDEEYHNRKETKALTSERGGDAIEEFQKDRNY